MDIPKLKSQSPKIHDNTEEDVILVPPSVLDNKLRNFEENQRIKGGIASEITLAVTLLIAISTTTFNNFYFISGPTIKGAFLIGFIIILIKAFYGLYKIFFVNRQKRTDIIKNLINNYNSKKEK